MARRPKHPIEYLSDIGKAAFDLRAFSDQDIATAMQFMVSVNPDLFRFLADKIAGSLPPVVSESAGPSNGR